MGSNVTIIALLGSNDILLFFSPHVLQESGPKMDEIAKFFHNGKKFAIPVKALFTSKAGKPVLPVFNTFYP